MIIKSDKNTGAIFKGETSYGSVFKGETLVWQKKSDIQIEFIRMSVTNYSSTSRIFYSYVVMPTNSIIERGIQYYTEVNQNQQYHKSSGIVVEIKDEGYDNLYRYENSMTPFSVNTYVRSYVIDRNGEYHYGEWYVYVPDEGQLFKYSKDVGDIVLENNNTGYRLIIKPDDIEKINKENYTPVGIIVVPSSHDVYGTGEGAMMSVKQMSAKTPDQGTSGDVALYCGGTENLANHINLVPSAPNINDYTLENPSIKELIRVGQSVYLPSDYYLKDNYICGHDKNTGYNDPSRYSKYFAPSPYLSDGSRNPLYYTVESPSSSENCFSDFNGKRNSEILQQLSIEQNWRTSQTIDNDDYYGGEDYVHACCCWRYHTLSTNQGDWYLPSAGEAGYIGPRYNIIKKSLDEVISTWSIGSKFNSSFYWTSSITSGTVTPYFITWTRYGVLRNAYDTSYSVYAFCRI